jgi:hypothetical protein
LSNKYQKNLAVSYHLRAKPLMTNKKFPLKMKEELFVVISCSGNYAEPWFYLAIKIQNFIIGI